MAINSMTKVMEFSYKAVLTVYYRGTISQEVTY